MKVDANTVVGFGDLQHTFRLDDMRWPEGRWALLLEALHKLPCDYAYDLCRDSKPPIPKSYDVLDEDVYWWLWIEDPALALEFKLRWG